MRIDESILNDVVARSIKKTVREGQRKFDNIITESIRKYTEGNDRGSRRDGGLFGLRRRRR